MQINFPRIKKNKKNKKRYIIKKNKKEKENESLRRLFVLMELVINHGTKVFDHFQNSFHRGTIERKEAVYFYGTDRSRSCKMRDVMGQVETRA